jgi:putative hydrolase of the HAD superfamily
MTRTREFDRLLGEDWDKMETFVQHALGADVESVIRPEAVSIIQAAKAAGKKLAIPSNELDLFYGVDFRCRLPLLQLFDVIVDATYTGILKHAPRAYETVTEARGLSAQACVFVDGQRRNADGDVKAGLQVVHFDVLQPQASFDTARQLLALPSNEKHS